MKDSGTTYWWGMMKLITVYIEIINGKLYLCPQHITESGYIVSEYDIYLIPISQTSEQVRKE